MVTNVLLLGVRGIVGIFGVVKGVDGGMGILGDVEGVD